MEGKVLKTVARAAVLFGLETVRESQEVELEVAEVKILIFTCGETRIDVNMSVDMQRFGSAMPVV